MAKEQNLALNPNKISGQCGRLLCCLDYEYETYCSLRKTFPKCGKRVRTASANGIIDKLNILTGTITLRMDDGKLVVVKRDEVLGDAIAEDNVPVTTPARQISRQEPRERTRSQRPANSRPAAALPPEKKTEAGDMPVVKPETDALTVAPSQEAQPGKKKKRNRRHGHRKPGNSPQQGNAGSDSTRSEP
jgi:hypothetical protein